MKPIVRSVLGAVVLLLAARASAEETMTHELARKHYEIGKTYYDIANYAQALEEFKKAYKLQPLPALRFNMGRCYEGLGNLQQAIAEYELYLSKQPDAENRSTIELRIENLKRRVAQQPPPVVVVPRPPVNLQAAPSTPVKPEAVPVSAPGPSRWKRAVGWTTLGLGVAALGTGIAIGAMVSSKSSEYQDGVAAGKTYFELDQIKSSGQSYQTGEIALLVAGGLIAASGVGLVIWDALGGRESRASSGVGVVPYFSGTSLGLCGSKQF